MTWTWNSSAYLCQFAGTLTLLYGLGKTWVDWNGQKWREIPRAFWLRVVRRKRPAVETASPVEASLIIGGVADGHVVPGYTGVATVDHENLLKEIGKVRTELEAAKQGLRIEIHDVKFASAVAARDQEAVNVEAVERAKRAALDGVLVAAVGVFLTLVGLILSTVD